MNYTRIALAAVLVISLLLFSIVIYPRYIQKQPEPPVDFTKVVATVYFFDVGQGDAILLDYNSTECLIDAGPESCSSTLLAYLKPLVQDPIETVIVTHPHEDHIGGMPKVLQTYSVTDLWKTTDYSESTIYNYFMDSIATSTTLHELQPTAPFVQFNKTIPFTSDISFQLLSCGGLDDTNGNSVVTRLDFPYAKDSPAYKAGDTASVLFMGDATSATEDAILHPTTSTTVTFNLSPVDILKVGHHGSASSTSTEFLAKVRPTYSIISLSSTNTYNHPNPSTISRLQNSTIVTTESTVNYTNSEPYKTNGTIKVEIGEETYRVIN